MDKITSIKPEVGFKFEANGKNYIIEDKLSIMRAIEASKLELELFELSSTSIKNTLINAYNDLNGSNKDRTVKFADAAIKIHNLINKIDRTLDFKDTPILRYCALYINEEKEDRRTITSERIDDKINDWQEGGYDINGFFLLCLSALPNVRKNFLERMEAISKEKEKGNKK